MDLGTNWLHYFVRFNNNFYVCFLQKFKLVKHIDKWIPMLGSGIVELINLEVRLLFQGVEDLLVFVTLLKSYFKLVD